MIHLAWFLLSNSLHCPRQLFQLQPSYPHSSSQRKEKKKRDKVILSPISTLLKSYTYITLAKLQSNDHLVIKETLKIVFILVDHMPSQNLRILLLRKKIRARVTMKLTFQTETLLSCKRVPFIIMPGQDTVTGTSLGRSDTRKLRAVSATVNNTIFRGEKKCVKHVIVTQIFSYL